MQTRAVGKKTKREKLCCYNKCAHRVLMDPEFERQFIKLKIKTSGVKIQRKRGGKAE